MTEASGEAERILFGGDTTPGIVAVEPAEESVTVYRRTDGRVTAEELPFKRWILTSEKHSLRDAAWTELEGEGFRWLAEFPDRNAYQQARFWLRDAHAPHIAMPSASKQFLIRSGMTLFKDMGFDDAVRLQLDIETLALSPDKPENEIFLVAVSDNAGFERLISGEEKSILRQIVECVRERDPDVIEGHNILGFDLPYIAARAKLHGVRLALGRNGSEMTCGSSQTCAIGYAAIPALAHLGQAGRGHLSGRAEIRHIPRRTSELFAESVRGCAGSRGARAMPYTPRPHRPRVEDRPRTCQNLYHPGRPRNPLAGGDRDAAGVLHDSDGPGDLRAGCHHRQRREDQLDVHP
jgi:hypothetical protein